MLLGRGVVSGNVPSPRPELESVDLGSLRMRSASKQRFETTRAQLMDAHPSEAGELRRSLRVGGGRKRFEQGWQ